MRTAVSKLSTGLKFELLGLAGAMLACGFGAQAETVSGTVIDPQRLAVVGAKVSLVCGTGIDSRKTDAEGNFTFTRHGFAEDCKVRTEYPGFDLLELPLGNRRTVTIQLHVAQQKESISVRAETIFPASLESVTLSGNELREISSNSMDLITYAKELAGAYSGSDSLYVDGLPADHPPPADRIAAIAINADPFSAEYSDAGNNHVEIITKTAEREFRITDLGLSLGTRAPDGLNPSLGSTSTTASAGISGPVPFLPLAFTTNVRYADRQAEEPVEAVVPSVAGSSITPVAAASTGSRNLAYGLGTDYSQQEALRVRASLYVMNTSYTNMGVGGLSLPETGVNQNSSGQEFRATFTETGKHFVSRGGIAADWVHTDLNADSTALGLSVLGAFNTGGADISRETSQWMRWTLKDVTQFNWNNHLWSIGATVSRRADMENTIPNPHGHIYFNDSNDYVLSATTGADLGTAMIMQGSGNVGYTSYTVSPFVEAELLRRTRYSVRGGVRADAQTDGGVLFSPRFSAIANLRGFVLGAGTGMFLKNWSNDIFLKVMENDGHHLQRYLITNTSLASVTSGTESLQPEIISALAPSLEPMRDWESKLSLERPISNFLPGVEYTWTDGTHLTGSQRLSSLIGWTDWLESNRAQQKHQIHVRVRYKMSSQTFTAHYEWIHSRDNTDGPFSFPALQSDIRGEWGPSSNIAAHNVTFVANSKVGKAVSLTVVENWHSAYPLNLISGLDPENNGLYTDRAGLPRNSGREGNFNSVDLFAHRRFALPEFLLGPRLKTYLDCNLQVLNALGNRNYLTFGNVIGSPVFEQPLAAAPGRSFRFAFGFSH